MRLRRPLAAAAAIAAALAGTTIVGTTTAGADASGSGTSASPQTILVLSAEGASATATRAAIRDLGGRVVDVNKAIGLYTVRTSTKGFAAKARQSDAVTAAAEDRSIGYAPGTVAPGKKVEREHVGATNKGTAAVTAEGAAAGDPAGREALGPEHGRRVRRARPSTTATSGCGSASSTPASTPASPTWPLRWTAGCRATSSLTCPTSTGRASSPAARTRTCGTTPATAPTWPARWPPLLTASACRASPPASPW